MMTHSKLYSETALQYERCIAEFFNHSKVCEKNCRKICAKFGPRSVHLIQHFLKCFYRLPAAGQQVIRFLLVLLLVLKTKLQIYRISCCYQAKQVGDEAEVKKT